MATSTVVGNTLTAASTVGIREDLSDNIFNIDPTKVPFMTRIGTGAPAKNKLTEWQIVDIPSPQTTAVADGARFDFSAAQLTKRVGNYTQIQERTVTVADNLRRYDEAGRADELAFQVMLKGKALMRDIESALLKDQGGVEDTKINANTTGAGTARVVAGFPAWLLSNVNMASAGSPSNPTHTGIVPSSGRTAGTARAFAIAQLRDVSGQIFDETDEDPTTLMLGRFNREKFNSFSGQSATTRTLVPQGGAASLVDANEVWVGSFHRLEVVTNRWQPAGMAFIVNPNYAERAICCPIEIIKSAKVAHSEQRVIRTEHTLRVLNEAAHGIVADLTTS